MALFLPGSLLLEVLFESGRIGEYLQRELEQAAKWGWLPQGERLEELRRAVDRLVDGCSRATAFARHLRCEPLIYTGNRSTEQVLALLEQIWPEGNAGAESTGEIN